MSVEKIKTEGLKGLKVLVLGEDARSFLSVIRSLGKAGCRVDVVCFDQMSPSRTSKYINRAWFFNHRAYSDQNWQLRLLDVLQEQQYDFVIPCDERAIFPLQQLQDQLPARTVLCITNAKAMDVLFDKYKTKQVALQTKVNVSPGQLYVLSAISFAELEKCYGLPFVIKPLQSYDQGHLSSRNAVLVCRSEEEFLAYQEHVETGIDFLVEAYFEGVGEGVSVLSIDGELKAVFAHKRVHEPKGGGGSSYRISITVESALYDACRAICKTTDYTGVGMFEFRRNPESQEWILVEVNARFWGSLPLAIYAGIDFPKLYLLGLTGQLGTGCQDQYKVPVYARALTTDVYQSKSEIESVARNKGILAAMVSACSKIWEYHRLVLLRETIDSFDWLDMGPFGAECKALWSGSVEYRYRSQFKSYRSRHEKALAVLKAFYEKVDAKSKIIFVCYGNIMRSPFAHAYYQQQRNMLDLSITSSSLGFHQREGRKSPDVAVNAAKSFSVDLSAHRSAWLQQNEVSDNHLYVIFDFKNEELAKRFYQLPNLLCAADLLPKKFDKYQQIEDPYESDLYHTERCYFLIRQAVDVLIETQQDMLEPLGQWQTQLS